MPSAFPVTRPFETVAILVLDDFHDFTVNVLSLEKRIASLIFTLWFLLLPTDNSIDLKGMVSWGFRIVLQTAQWEPSDNPVFT